MRIPLISLQDLSIFSKERLPTPCFSKNTGSGYELFPPLQGPLTAVLDCSRVITLTIYKTVYNLYHYLLSHGYCDAH